MDFLNKPLDLEDLEEELQKALNEDTLYDLQNDAKLRAIEQKVPTYEQFRQMVQAAHLKPLSQKEKLEKSNSSWNCYKKKSN
ncbi:hypothetical protein HCN44_000008 [Aphidius gifuensis]|uniref:Dynein attachment factor N-terminal domain-containing protein n=1 Tax=Aphidius gifuensis TaxID=684658 RepID=A0A834XPH2_APHGI|nr:hypothetical protein HCN44_000008 [Aphidius gifuensis]